MAVQATQTSVTVAPSTQGVTLTLGPRPYNRFLGNPPSGRTPEECFKEENGYDWVTEVSAQPYTDLVHGLETQITQLQAQASKK